MTLIYIRMTKVNRQINFQLFIWLKKCDKNYNDEDNNLKTVSSEENI